MQLDLEFRSKQSNSLQRKTKLDNKTIFNTNDSVSKTELNSSLLKINRFQTFFLQGVYRKTQDRIFCA